MSKSLIVMGVSGCGKSSLAQALAQALHWKCIEGDAFHPQANVDKMRAGVALTDEDRAGWLDALGRQLQIHEHAVLTCSALRLVYRHRLRQSSPQVRFVHLMLSIEQARERVAQRSDHYFNPDLVASQFQTLESTAAEADVLELDATLSPETLLQAVIQWMGHDKP
jgi:gluconokinase